MTLRKLLLTGLLAGGTYHLYKNRLSLIDKWTTTQDVVHNSRARLSDIKHHLETLTQETEHLQTITEELAYRYRVFSKETQGHLAEIQNVMAKYQKQDNNHSHHQK